MGDEQKEIIWDELRLRSKCLVKTKKNIDFLRTFLFNPLKKIITKGTHCVINALGNPLSLSTELKWSIEIQCASFNHYESV